MYAPVPWPIPFFTIGHSTHPIEEFVALLTAAEVRLVVDVRTVPRSRTNPQFNRDDFARLLSLRMASRMSIVPRSADCAESSLAYPPRPSFWENASFHNYADYALSEEFRSGLEKLRALGHASALDRHVRGKPLVAMPSPDHCRLSDRRGRGGLPHPRPRSHRASAFDARSPDRAGWEANLSEGHAAHARPPAMSGFAVRAPKRFLPSDNKCLQKIRRQVKLAV